MGGRSRRIVWAAAPCAAILALAACTAPVAPPSTATTAGPQTPPGSGERLPDPSGAVTVMPGQRGDCPIEPADPALVTFVVTTGDDTSATKVTYPVARSDGQRTIRRMTGHGPVITVVTAPSCTGGDEALAWHYVATSDRASALSCALFVGGELVGSDAASGVGPLRVDCSS